MGPHPGSHSELPSRPHTHRLLSCFSLTAECLTRVTAATLETVCYVIAPKTYPDLCPRKQGQRVSKRVCQPCGRADELTAQLHFLPRGLALLRSGDPPLWSQGVFRRQEGAGGAVCAHLFVHLRCAQRMCVHAAAVKSCGPLP